MIQKRPAATIFIFFLIFNRGLSYICVFNFSNRPLDILPTTYALVGYNGQNDILSRINDSLFETILSRIFLSGF